MVFGKSRSIRPGTYVRPGKIQGPHDFLVCFCKTESNEKTTEITSREFPVREPRLISRIPTFAALARQEPAALLRYAVSLLTASAKLVFYIRHSRSA